MSGQWHEYSIILVTVNELLTTDSGLHQISTTFKSHTSPISKLSFYISQQFGITQSQWLNRRTGPVPRLARTLTLTLSMSRRTRSHSPGCMQHPIPSPDEHRANILCSNPHPIFVIILVGPEECPFGIQKDFLCARSEFYEKHFAAMSSLDKVEHLVKLPDTTKEIFGLAQHFLYTDKVISDESNVPSYEALVGLWKLGHHLGIKGLCDKALDAMVDCRRLTERIPATPLLIQVWQDTPEGSSIRKLLLSWTAEYMRSSDARAEFAKSLPQEVLSELVVAMSSFDTAPAVERATESIVVPSTIPAATPRKNVHYLEDEPDSDAKKARRVSGIPISNPSSADRSIKARVTLPKPAVKRRTSAGYADGREFSTARKMEFCADLLSRMLSGPGT